MPVRVRFYTSRFECTLADHRLHKTLPGTRQVTRTFNTSRNSQSTLLTSAPLTPSALSCLYLPLRPP